MSPNGRERDDTDADTDTDTGTDTDTKIEQENSLLIRALIPSDQGPPSGSHLHPSALQLLSLFSLVIVHLEHVEVISVVCQIFLARHLLNTWRDCTSWPSRGWVKPGD